MIVPSSASSNVAHHSTATTLPSTTGSPIRTFTPLCVPAARAQYARMPSCPTFGSRNGDERYEASSVKSVTSRSASFCSQARR